MSKGTPILNVAIIEDHRKRHNEIFKSFDNLKEGEAFIIRNDHDPLSVFFQLKARSEKNNVGWEYLNKGSDTWDVKVTKKND